MNTAIEAFGQLDILINNAGILRDKSLIKMESADWEAVMTVHLTGTYNVTRPAFIKMKEKGYGRIVVTISGAGLYGNFGQTNYSAAKMGLIGFMNSLKLEAGKSNIKVNAIAPFAATRLTQDFFPPDQQKKLKPDFVAPLVIYLCSEALRETGMIFNVGMGYFSRAAIVTSRGVVIGDGQTPPSPEDIQSSWESIKDLSEAKEINDAISALRFFMRDLNHEEKSS